MKKLDHSKATGCAIDEKLTCLRPRRSARTAANLDLLLEVPSIAEEEDMATGEIVEVQTSSFWEDVQLLPGKAISGLSQPPSQVCSDYPSLLPLPLSAELRCGSEFGKIEKGDNVEGSGLDGIIPSVQAFPSPTASADAPDEPSSVLTCVEAKGEGDFCSVQGSSVTDHAGLTAEAMGLLRVQLVSDGGQVQRNPLMAGEGLGISMAEAAAGLGTVMADSGLGKIMAGATSKGSGFFILTAIFLHRLSCSLLCPSVLIGVGVG
ncbi:hypothetical protein Dimus_010709 [Dionaea muscipula]